MGKQRWLGFTLLSFVWSILLKQVDSARFLLQKPEAKINFSLPSIPFLQTPPLLPSLLQSQPPPLSLIPNMPGSIPPSTLPTWPTFSISPLPSFQWNNPSPPPPSFPWIIPSPSLFSWTMPSPPPPSFPWTNLTNPFPTIPILSWSSPSPPPPNAQIFPWTNVTNPLPTIPTLPWYSPSSPPPSNPSFPWSTPLPPPNSPLFPWVIPSPPPLSFPWNNLSPQPPLLNFPSLSPSPPFARINSPLPSFGLPPGSPLFPTGIQFTFSNFSQSWLPEAGVKVTWQSVILVELSLQLFVEALMKPINLILSAIQGTQNSPQSWSWKSGLTDNKLNANVGAFCTISGKDGFRMKGIVVAQTPIDSTLSTAITWFTILLNGWSEDMPPKVVLDRTLGSFGGFVTNSTTTNLKTFCSHPESLNVIAVKQGQYVLN